MKPTSIRSSVSIAGLAFGLMFSAACPSDGGEAAEDDGNAPRGNDTNTNDSELPAGGFGGDDELAGTWDVTLDHGGEALECIARIDANLAFEITCDEGPREYDVDCAVTVSTLRLSGSIDAGTGSLKMHEIRRYDGPACASYDLTNGETREQTELDAELTRTNAGVGGLGGTWMASFFEWECLSINDDSCEDSERGRGSYADSPLKCSFDLANDGAITLSCTGDDNDTGADGIEVDCMGVIDGEGEIGDGKLAVELTGSDVGSECDSEGGDSGGLSVYAERR